MMKAEQCRTKAAECAELALKSQDVNRRELYRNLAQRWREAAERLEQTRRFKVIEGGRRS
jgi:hypothetical protein